MIYLNTGIPVIGKYKHLLIICKYLTNLFVLTPRDFAVS